jgi:hypothetical protein
MEKDLGHLAAEGCNLARSSSPAFAAAPGQVEKVMLLQLEILVTLLKDNASGIKLLDDILESSHISLLFSVRPSPLTRRFQLTIVDLHHLQIHQRLQFFICVGKQRSSNGPRRTTLQLWSGFTAPLAFLVQPMPLAILKLYV